MSMIKDWLLFVIEVLFVFKTLLMVNYKNSHKNLNYFEHQIIDHFYLKSNKLLTISLLVLKIYSNVDISKFASARDMHTFISLDPIIIELLKVTYLHSI